ncbi:HTH-type transcriptional activator IlvY [Endozoicomonas elysicola]|uniref:Transcriptional regulator n=1 Tax=Endozoicomonas elysicola TaxID=305900 RepID=A0A081K6J9_9GAMM|nr:HTH-type transcriptional activator IlvY [Endozoicomonas elysicola]KEI69775.1 transcriptional regulator [Endozoicomonas elysicola]
MDLRPLKQFLALAESLHFNRASLICHVSPSTLSRTIKQLEDQLGVALFERDNRSVSLTSEGERFQTYAREALSQWEIIHNELMAGARELHGSLSMYCSVTASYSFLYEILSQFRPKYPGIEIKLHTGDPEPAIQRVLTDQEDLAIAARPDNLPAGLAFQQIAVSPLLFIAPVVSQLPDSLFEKQLQVHDFDDVPMILQEKGIARQRLDSWFQANGRNPKIYAQVAGNEAIVSMVSLGFGVGVVPEIVLSNSPLAANVQVLKVSPELKPYKVGLCVLEKKLRNPLIAALWNQLSDIL